MDRQKNRQSSLRQSGKARQPARLMQQAIQRGGQLSPALFHMGPFALSICSVLLISFMAILYLSQLGQAVTTNQQIQDMHTQQAALQRQNSDLVNTVAQEQAPGYIAARAKAMGLAPAEQQNTRAAVVPHLRPITKEQSDQP